MQTVGVQGEHDAVEADMDAANYHTLMSRMDELCKKARKLGVVEPELEVLEKYERIVGPEDDRTVETRYRVRVMGGFPHLDGWHFVATIEPSESKQGGNMLYAVPGETVPEQYRAATMDCDHCGTNRYRTQTFIVRHDDGRYAQVGRNCLADFLGSSATPAMLAKQAEFGVLIRQMVEAPGEFMEYGGSGEWHVDTIGFVTMVAACARTYGFVTSKQYREALERGEGSGQPTGRQAWIFEVDSRAFNEAKKDGFTIEDRDIELAKSAVYWGSQQDGDGDFAYNMRLVATSDAITWKQAGIAAYLVEGYRRDLERETKEKVVAKVAGAESQWLGEVGDRVHFYGTVTYTREFDGSYGTTVLVKLVDQTGNVAATFTSGRWAEDLEVGEGLAIVGTIKKLEEYRGEKQTMLTRVKVEG